MLAVINIGISFGFLRSDLRNRCFLVTLYHHIVRRQTWKMRPGGFPTSRSNTVVILVPCCTWKCLPTACSSGVGYSRDPWVLHVRTDEFSVRVTQIVSKMSHELTIYLSDFYVIFDSVAWLCYQKSINQPSLNHLTF